MRTLLCTQKTEKLWDEGKETPRVQNAWRNCIGRCARGAAKVRERIRYEIGRAGNHWLLFPCYPLSIRSDLPKRWGPTTNYLPYSHRVVREWHHVQRSAVLKQPTLCKLCLMIIYLPSPRIPQSNSRLCFKFSLLSFVEEYYPRLLYLHFLRVEYWGLLHKTSLDCWTPVRVLLAAAERFWSDPSHPCWFLEHILLLESA